MSAAGALKAIYTKVANHDSRKKANKLQEKCIVVLKKYHWQKKVFISCRSGS